MTCSASMTTYLADPGALLAALPALVGFTPQQSLVAVALEASPEKPATGWVSAVLRFDLHNEHGALPARAVANALTGLDDRPQADNLIVVVVDPQHGDPWTRTLISDLADHLALAEIGLSAAYGLSHLLTGTAWQDLLDPARTGVLPDPAQSAATFGAVLAGRHVYRSRAELAALLAPDPELTAAVARELTSVTAESRDAGTIDPPDGVESLKSGAEFVLEQIAATDSGPRPDPGPRELARLALALRDKPVRDIAFALTDGERAPAAERLWHRLARAVTGTDRADAATLAGYSAYLRKDGPLAGIAFDVALTAHPGYPIAAMLATSLSTGVPPEHIHRLARSGLEIAAEIGLPLTDHPQVTDSNP